MSDQTPENPEAVELPRSGDDAFASLMDVLAPEEAPAPGGEGGAPAEPAAADGAGAAAETGAPAAPLPTAGEGAGDGRPAGGGAPAGDAAAAPDAPAGGTGGETPVPDGGRPAAWTRAAADVAPQIESLSGAFEERATQAYQQAALGEVREEYSGYFTALNKPPVLLVGTEVPAIGKEGMITLQDKAEAAEWQEVSKHLLAEEVRGRASKAMDEQSDFLTTIHASIDLFKDNRDLIPGTKDFDVELANRFVAMATPYELSADGKLQGYTIPVQPLVDQIRDQLAKERSAAATKATPASGTAAAAASTPAAAATKPPADPPQAGIPSKAGNSAEQGEDFSTLWGTLGLPNIQI